MRNEVKRGCYILFALLSKFSDLQWFSILALGLSFINTYACISVMFILSVINFKEVWSRIDLKTISIVFSIIFAGLNAVTLWAALILSQNLIIDVSGFPAVDYPMTRSFLTFVFYIPLSTIGTFCFCFFYVLESVGRVIKGFLSMHMLNMILKSVPFGMLVVVLVFILVYTSFVTPVWMAKFVRQVMYNVDYNYYRSLEYVRDGQKVVLHANGVISIAREGKNGIEISRLTTEKENLEQ